jgi:hypothetical protein
LPGGQEKLMRKIADCLSCLILIALAVGCAAQVAPIYPKAEGIAIHVSPGTVSTWTETAAQDFLIPNSQVFITGRGSDAAKYFGLLGAAVSRSQNEAAVAAAEDGLRLNFAPRLAQLLNLTIASRPPATRFAVVQTADRAQVTVLPSAKLALADDYLARLSFRLTVRFNDATTSAATKKEYFYYHGGGKPLSGPDDWLGDGADAVRKASDEAFASRADVLLDDIAGDFSGAFDTDKQRFIIYSVVGSEGKNGRALLLKDYPNHLAIAPMNRERALKGVVVVLPRRSIVLQPT